MKIYDDDVSHTFRFILHFFFVTPIFLRTTIMATLLHRAGQLAIKHPILTSGGCIASNYCISYDVSDKVKEDKLRYYAGQAVTLPLAPIILVGTGITIMSGMLASVTLVARAAVTGEPDIGELRKTF